MQEAGKTHREEGGALATWVNMARLFLRLFVHSVGASVSLTIDLEGIPDKIGSLPVEVQGVILRVEESPAERGAGGFASQY